MMNTESTTETAAIPGSPGPSTTATAKSKNSSGRQGLDSPNTIEQLLHNLPANCTQETRFGSSFTTQGPHGTTYRHAPCRRLNCQYCGRTFFNRAHDSLRDACLNLGLDYFITLTLPKDIPLAKFKAALRKILLYSPRSFERPIHYAWVLGTTEPHQHHIHLLINRDLRRATKHKKRIPWLKHHWHHLTGAQQVDVSQIAPETHFKVIRYMLCNLFETVLQNITQTRRYGSSRAIKFQPRYPRNPEDPRVWKRNCRPSGFHAKRLGVDQAPICNPEFTHRPEDGA